MTAEARRAREAIAAAGGLMGIREVCEALGIPYGSRGNVRPMLAHHKITPVAPLAAGPVYLRCEVMPLAEARRRAKRDAAGRAYIVQAPEPA